MKYHIMWDSIDGTVVPEGRVRGFVSEYIANGGGFLCIADMEIFAELRIRVRCGEIKHSEIVVTDREDRTFYINENGQPLNDFWRYHCRLYDDQLYALLS